MFCCSECNICALVPKDTDADGPDSAYLEFLDLYDNGRIANSVDLNTIMQQERILRPSSEIKAYSKKVTKEQRTSYSRRCYLLRRIMW